MIKNKLRSILKNRKISIVQLSKATGLNRRTIYQFMNSKGLTYNLNTMSVICDYLNININDIIYYVEKNLKINLVKSHNNINFNKIDIDDETQYVSNMTAIVSSFKNDELVAITKIKIMFFKYNNKYVFSYDLPKTSSYERSIFSNNENMKKVAIKAINMIFNYVQALKLINRYSNENLIDTDISNNILVQRFTLKENEKYNLDIIPYYNGYINDPASPTNPDAIPEDSSKVNIKAEMASTNNKKIKINNLNEHKEFKCLVHKINEKYFMDDMARLYYS